MSQAQEQVSEPLPRRTPVEAVRRFLRRLWPRKRGWRVVVVVAALLVIALVSWLVFVRPSDSSAATQYRTTTVAKSTLTSTVSASGTLKPLQESDLSFASSGTVTAVNVAVGDSVTKGETLAKLDPSSLKVALQSAKADLTAAQESLTSLEDDSTSSTAAIAAAKATVTVKRNAVTQATTDLAGASLTAPFSGVVSAVSIAKGDSTGSGGSSTGSGTTSGGTSGGTSGTTTNASTSSSSAITVISKGTYTVSTSVSNSDVSSIKKGMQATITQTGVTGTIFGTVSSVGVVASSSSDSTSGSSTFPVTVKVTGTHTNLLPGSTVTVAITTQQLTDVISVNTAAITTNGADSYVQRLVNGKEVATKVTLGKVIGQNTVITDGLKVGDQVVVATYTAGKSSGTSSNRGSYGGTSGAYGGAGFPGGTGGGAPGGAAPGGAAPGGAGQGGGR